MDALAQARLSYARQIVAAAGLRDATLVQAFAAVPRERYLGPPPWRIFGGGEPAPQVTADAAQLYQDVLVSLVAERGINNGQPSLHAQCIGALQVKPGDSVVHVGAGSGYYTAVLAQLAGPQGRVHAYEVERALAALSAANLTGAANVQLHHASAATAVLPPADAIYVSAGVSQPPAGWFDALRPGGRLLFPLTADDDLGAVLLLTRRGASGEAYGARFLERVAFIPCSGARDPAASAALARALRARPLEAVRSLRRGTPPDAGAWYAGRDWWLSTGD